MASVQDRLKIRRENVAAWSTREQLCLASSVLKSGDQNWIAVSRSLRPFAEKDVLRPADWFSQKSCAIQYALLLENADTPKRKKRESGETTGESIVKRLTQERIAELGQILTLQRDEYKQLKSDLNLLKSGPINDDKLQKMWLAIEQEEREQEQKAKTHSVWSIKRPHKQETLSQATPTTPKKINDNNESQETIETPMEVDDDKKTQRGQSTLLTTLLKSPSPTTQIQNTTSTAQVTSPTIASLLGSSSKIITTSQTTTNVTPQLHQLVSCAMSTGTSERPSAGAPTLSMLLALPANLSKVQSTAETSELPEAESMVQIIDHIDGVIGKDKIADVIDKDEINEIIGDIEELIKEEITRSPQTTEASTPVVIETLPLLPEKTIEPEQPESESIDEPVSLPNSPESEMAIEEIDHSTSNIAEIIGTAIEPVETKSDVPITSENDLFTEDKSEEDQSVEIEIKTEEKNIATSIESVSDSTEVKEVDEKVEEKIIESEDTEEISEVQLKDVETQESKIEVVVPEENDEKVVEKKEIIEKEEQTFIEEHDESDDILLKLDESDENKKAEEISISLDKEDVVENKEQVQEANEENKGCILDAIDMKNEETEGPKIEKMLEVEEQTIEKKSVPEPIEILEIPQSKEEEREEKEEVLLDTEKPVEESKMIIEENETVTEIVEEKIEESKEEVTEVIEDVKTEVTKIEEKNNEEPESAPAVSEVSDVKEDSTEKAQEVTEVKVEIENNTEENETKNEEAAPLKEEIIEEKSGEAEEVQEEMKEIKEEKIQKEMEVEEKVEETEKKKEPEEVEMKKEETNTTEDADAEEEESSLTKLSGRAMKTYSKKYNVAVDSEPETESSEGADYRAWKKAVMVVYNRLATHKYASAFLRPITEDQAPGYHSVIFRPMDLSTIKKNIDNGTIRSTMQFQRDVMLMFQNAIMYNKHDTFVYQMTMTMQEECLQHMQILVQVTGEGPFRRETRTAASSSNDLSETNIVKRKRSHITPSPHDSESPRMKKRRKSEND
ncbi:bromodomain-containing protein 8 isoform X2 [Chelonus insularis]|uniref:bromodomain-containing protein 8 isoform X2 n=1 Tax=Chelonus insularis TaxID=460826 RepID=UPI00158C90AC|nr:bromodomain-containing protein 8 isoform X2 [Chelonus insularis]